MIAYSYLRFSTPEQAAGDSLRRQVALADDYARRHGLTLDTELNLRDLGVSGYRGDNVAIGALGAFLKAIKDGLVAPGSMLLVESLDRISRQQARKAVRILEEIVEAGVDVVTLNDGKRYTEESLAGTDFLIAIIILMRAHEESATKGKRVAAAWSAKRVAAANGKLLTRLTPGWVRAVQGKRELVPERAKIVRRIFDMFLQGIGQVTIARTLNDAGVPTFGRAAHWQKSYIAKILRNPAVIGTLIPHTDDGTKRTPQEPIEDYFPAAIDVATFRRAQSLLEGMRTASRSQAVQNILARLAVCPVCGGAMTRVWKGVRGGEPKLVCAAAKVGKCEYVSVPLPAVQHALIRTAGNPLPRAEKGLDAEVRSAEAGLEAIDEAIEELVEAIEQSSSPTLLKRLKAREEMRERAQATLKELEQRAVQSDTKLVKLRTARYRAAMQAQPFDVAAANAALREMVSKVVINYKRQTLQLHWRHDGETEVDYEI